MIDSSKELSSQDCGSSCVATPTGSPVCRLDAFFACRPTCIILQFKIFEASYPCSWTTFAHSPGQTSIENVDMTSFTTVSSKIPFLTYENGLQNYSRALKTL